MTSGHDPSNPHGGQGGWSPPPQPAQQGGWSAPQQHPPPQQPAPPVPGYGAPAPQPQGGWSAPPQHPPAQQSGWTPPQQPAPQQSAPQGGWTAPQQPAPQGQGWNPPAAPNANTKASWQESSSVRSPVDWFFKPPPDLDESKHGLYKLLTFAAGPLIVLCFLAFYMFKARYRRHGVTGFFAGYAHFLGTALYSLPFYYLGGALGFNGWYLATPIVVLTWIPLAARYALWKLS